MAGFLALLVWGAYIWRGLYTEGLIFGILRYTRKAFKVKHFIIDFIKEECSSHLVLHVHSFQRYLTFPS